jgi:RecB family exonuclease
MSAFKTSRATRLIRVPTLRCAHQVLAALAGNLDLEGAHATLVVVASLAAATQARRTIERLVLGARASALVHAQLGLDPPTPRAILCPPAFVAREGLYAQLHARLPGAPPLVDDFDRDAVMRASAADAIAAGARPPFALRPAIVAEMVAFYDALMRRQRRVDDFERLLSGTLSAEADTDRGAARLLEQTRFLVEAFRAFERRVAALDPLDEHGLRARAAAGALDPPLTHLIVMVGDIVSERGGLWPADYDLIATLPGLERVDVIATNGALSAGLYERLQERLPGIGDTDVDDLDPPPTLFAPGHPDGARTFVSRDREEELAGLARLIKAEHATRPEAAVAPDDHAVVVQRPLPYLYLARHTLDAAGIPWTAADALPLAAEPVAAGVDVICDAVLAEFSRTAVRHLLRSPQLRITDERGLVLDLAGVHRLDEELARTDFAGGWGHLRALLASRRDEGARAEAGPRARALARAAAGFDRLLDALEPLTRPAPMSEHIACLVRVLDEFEAPPPTGLPDPPRHARARAAVRGALRRMSESSLAHHDAPGEFREVAAALRRWIEARTFQPRIGSAGVHLLDADAARFADAHTVWVLGVVEGEWPEPGRRDLFYPSGLLTDLGWPSEAARGAAGRAAFVDLLRLARSRVAVSTFVLEDDAIVQPAVVLEEVDAADLPVERSPLPPPAMTGGEEALWRGPDPPATSSVEASAWLAWRRERTALPPGLYRGQIGEWRREAFAVTQVDTWIDCPFRYFAQHVLALEDEREHEPGLTPRERGELVHGILEEFYRRWGALGHGAITVESAGQARALFAQVVDERLATCGEADAAIERSALLGSAVALGMGERVFAIEVDRGAEVLERRLEERLDGTCRFAGAGGDQRDIAVRGKADRIDLLEGGQLELVDYKTGRAPGPRSIQLPIYAHVAEQRLAGHLGRSWRATAADYVAFRGRTVVRGLGRNDAERAERLARAQATFVDAVQRIGCGEFPARPAELRICTWCPYDTVCRLDYSDDVEA